MPNGKKLVIIGETFSKKKKKDSRCKHFFLDMAETITQSRPVFLPEKSVTTR